jgi:hypothetical protein
MSDLIPNVGAGTLLEQTLLSDDRAVRVGAIHVRDTGSRESITGRGSQGVAWSSPAGPGVALRTVLGMAREGLAP